MLTTNRDQERLALAFGRNLKRAGIEAQVRVVDAVQFERRRVAFDFDMMEYRWDQSLSPGNEQSFYWGSAAADQDGTRNYMGVKIPGGRRHDRRVAGGAGAPEFRRRRARARSRVAVRVLRRAALSICRKQWVARWNEVEHPSQTSLFGYLPETWWQSKTP